MFFDLFVVDLIWEVFFNEFAAGLLVVRGLGFGHTSVWLLMDL